MKLWGGVNDIVDVASRSIAFSAGITLSAGIAVSASWATVTVTLPWRLRGLARASDQGLTLVIVPAKRQLNSIIFEL